MEQSTGCCAYFHVALGHGPEEAVSPQFLVRGKVWSFCLSPIVMDSVQGKEACCPSDKESNRWVLRRHWLSQSWKGSGLGTGHSQHRQRAEGEH